MKDLRAALITSGTIVLVAVILSLTFFNRSRADDVVTVTGMRQMDFSADLIVWEGTIKRQAPDLAAAYGLLAQDAALIRDFMARQGIKAEAIVFRQIEIDEVFRNNYDGNGNMTDRTLVGYTLRQGFRIDSGDIATVEKASREVSELIKSGVAIDSASPKYFYSRLAELKVELIALATQDARSRAEKIAQEAGSSLGKTRYAAMGVFQIIGKNDSPDASWAGNFDTNSREKSATITVRLQYELR